MPRDHDGSFDLNDELTNDDAGYGDTDTIRDGPTNAEIEEQNHELAVESFLADHPDEDVPDDLSDWWPN